MTVPLSGPGAEPSVAAAVPVRDAATVLLLRDGPDGVEVWLQQRSPSLVFAAGMHAFPGGAVDDADRAAVAMSLAEMTSAARFAAGRPDAERHASVWGCDAALAAALVGAAVRETQEEADVTLAPSALVPWSRWITPVGPPRRFDARFFVAALPTGAAPRARSSEVHAARWVVVRAAVERHAAGDLPMWEPTLTTLVELTPYDTVEAVLAAAPSTIEPVTG